MASSAERIVLVTGGTRGIGEGVARHLAARGYRVVAAGFGADEVAAFAPQAGVEAVQLDVTSDESVAKVLAALPRLAGVVNCAGVIQRAGAEFTIEGFRKTVDVNLVGTMRVCLAAKPALVAGGGAVVNTASMLAFFGSAFVPGYSASKGGVAQLTKSLAAAWAAGGVRVNAVAPGWIETEMTRPLAEDDARSAALLARTPMGRWGKPADVAGVVAFLLSDDAKFVTGTVVPVDGGYLCV